VSQAFLSDERCVDLLIQQATSGLGGAESAELETLLARYPGADRRAFERAAASLSLAARGAAAEPLPPALRARLLEQGSAVVGRSTLAGLDAARRRHSAARPAPVARAAAFGWWAAAAALLIAVAGWYPRLSGPPAAPTLAQLRARLDSTPGVIRWQFVPSGDPGGAGASGEVVFDPASQHGYLRFVGLRPNDPRQSEYQLWIFDGERDDRYPVDGGVFDVAAATAEVIVPITARVSVGKPALFAVTVERPGGVVVSAREHIVVLAKPNRA